MTEKDPKATRWGKGTRADSGAAHESILDAALCCYKKEGIIKTTVEHVAKEAKVSRTTVYRYFKNRDEILTGVVLREAHQVLQAMQSALKDVGDIDEYLVEGMVFCLQMAPKMPLYRFGFGVEGAAMTSRLCFSSKELYEIGGEIIEPLYQRAMEKGQIPDSMDPKLIIEWAARILLSFLINPSPMTKTEEQQRALFSAFIKPVFKQNLLVSNS